MQSYFTTLAIDLIHFLQSVQNISFDESTQILYTKFAV